jgi:phosphoglycerate dehydrogenase-like enzyme
MLKGLFILNQDSYEKVYPPAIRTQIEKLIDIYSPHQTKESIDDNLSLLNEADVIFSGWGGAVMDEAFMQAAPNLKAVFYGAGSINGIVTDAFWKRNILIISSYAANAIPVAEYTLSQILFTLKNGWHFAQAMRKEDGHLYRNTLLAETPGAYGSTVGIISLGMIGRRVCELLRSFDVKVIAYDPYTTAENAAKWNVELCSLDDLFRRADVISLHTPWLKETEGMITGKHFASMKNKSTFINTARGAVVRENEMIEVLQNRPDLQAVLDVTYPEPPLPGSPLYTLPNVVLTPHIAGATTSSEMSRMGSYVLEELQRYVNGESPKWGITQKMASILA